MSNEDLQILIIKYLNDFITSEEKELLITQLEDPKVKDEFKKYLALNNMIIRDASQFEYKYPLRKALEKIKMEQKRMQKVIPLKRFLKYAAAIIILVATGYFFTQEYSATEEPIIVNTKIEIGTDKATLTLDDGTDIALEKGETFATNNLESNGEEIVYRKEEVKKEIAYNYLTIPRGGQYQVKLADGTKIWLNSESKLKYPTSFIDGEERKVELVYGEAYFDISPSTEHKGSKFKVFTKNQEIEVLGTEFNINAYKDESGIYTTLVEGKIAVANGEFNTILNPNQQSIIKDNIEGIYVVEADLFTATSWRKGIFSFENLSLEKIMQTLSRWYDVEVEFSNPKIKEENFTGVLRKNQNIEEILKIINTINNISYEIDNKKIILK